MIMHSTYQKLISQYIADVQTVPDSIVNMFKNGAFVVSFTGHSWHSVGLDEAHEMGINKECKASICIPNPDKMNQMAKYLTYRSTMLQNLKGQLFPTKGSKRETDYPQFTTEKHHHKSEHNMRTLIGYISSNPLFEIVKVDRGLLNVYSGQVASIE